MSYDKLRRQMAWEAARLIYDRPASDFYRAKMHAAHRVAGGWVAPGDLPSNQEIRDQMSEVARAHHLDRNAPRLRSMQLTAARLMRTLREFSPRLIRTAVEGRTKAGADIELRAYGDNLATLIRRLNEARLRFDIEQRRIERAGSVRRRTHIVVDDQYRLDIDLWPARASRSRGQSSHRPRTSHGLSLPELERVLAIEADHAIEPELIYRAAPAELDRFQVYALVLQPLENVRQSPKWHPEGDALCHSLQVFDLARDALPYDEEFLLAALLHDAGKAIDPADHVRAGLEALDGYITPRTAWLIEHHGQARALVDGTLGVRCARRLRAAESYDELMLLAECDLRGRRRDVEVPELEDALDYIRELSDMCDDET